MFKIYFTFKFVIWRDRIQMQYLNYTRLYAILNWFGRSTMLIVLPSDYVIKNWVALIKHDCKLTIYYINIPVQLCVLINNY